MLKRHLRLLVFALLAGVFLFSVIKLVGIGISYLKNRKAYRDIRDSSGITEASASPGPVSSAEPAANSLPSPTVTPEPLPFYPDWEQLKTVCPDIIGWLYLEGTHIHYPVVQTVDNEFYLTHNARQEQNSGGALFMDTDCHADSMNLIVYGHRMKDDSMLGDLPRYAEKSFLTAHPVMYYLTPEQNYRVEIFSCRTVKAEAKYFMSSFQSENEYRQYLEKAVEQSYWAAPIVPDPAYKTLTLATCSSYQGMNDPRLLVHGRLTPMH